MDVGRRKSDPNYCKSASPEKYPRDIKDFVEKKMASEYHFNKSRTAVDRTKSNGYQMTSSDHVTIGRSQDARRHSESVAPVSSSSVKLLKVKYQQRHHGDENMTDKDLNSSMLLSRQMSTSENNINEEGESESESDFMLMPANVSPMLIRRHSHSQDNPQIGRKIDLKLAKMAQIKLKLDPLPSRPRSKSVVTFVDDIRR